MFNMGSWKNPRFFDLPNFYVEKPGLNDREKSLQEIFDDAKKLVDQGIAGDVQAMKKALKALENLRYNIEANNLVEAYYGSTTAMVGREAAESKEGMEKVLEGLRILDESVASEPDNTKIRTLRGIVCFQLPETVFQRTKIAIEDFNYLVDRYEMDASVFSEEPNWQILYDLGMAHENMGEMQAAESIWQKSLSLNPDKKYIDLIQREDLTEYSLPAGAVIKMEQVDKDERPDYNDEISAWQNQDPGQVDGWQETDPESFFVLPEEDRNQIDASPENDTAGISQSQEDDMEASNLLSEEEANEMNEPQESGFNMTDAWKYYQDDFFIWQDVDVEDVEGAVEVKDNVDVVDAVDIEDAEDDIDDIDDIDNIDDYTGAWLQAEEDQAADQVDEEIAPSLDIKRKETFLEGFRLYELALAGDRRATRAALKLWEKIYQGDPQDTTAQAYYGGCLTLTARYASIVDMIFRNTADGLKLVNKAVGKDPGNLRLRYLRAYLTHTAPDNHFRMNELAIEDFEFLKQAYDDDHESFDRKLYHQILYDLGVAYRRANKNERTQEVWSKLLQESKDPKYKEILEGKDRGK